MEIKQAVTEIDSISIEFIKYSPEAVYQNIVVRIFATALQKQVNIQINSLQPPLKKAKPKSPASNLDLSVLRKIIAAYIMKKTMFTSVYSVTSGIDTTLIIH